MPSLSLLAPFKAKKKDKGKASEKDSLAYESPPESTNAVNSVSVNAPPPAYAAAPGNGDTSITSPPPAAAAAAAAAGPGTGKNNEDNVDITAAFSNLSLGSKPKDPEVDTCLAHLKLLFAFQALKEDVGLQDGLWNIWDTRASLNSDLVATDVPAAAYPPGFKIETATPEEVQKLHLSKLREKRWAIFVARAVDRYETWWASLPQVQLREEDMIKGASNMYEQFVEDKSEFPWASHMLPPLDVLMVWHAHMLNPRAFLEDTMRCGLSSFWATGMPWHLVSSAIDSNFNYNVPDETKTNWVTGTGSCWSNTGDSATTKATRCPGCQKLLEIPWTTCGRDENSKDSSTTPGLVGNGYADGESNWQCSGCGMQITRKVLSVAKFIKDARLLTIKSLPMPGTILDPISGKPKAISTDITGSIFPRTFANRMIKKSLMIQINDLLPAGDQSQPDMDTIRDLIQRVTSDSLVIRSIEGFSATTRFRLSSEARICIRKMMSHYWDNSSPFALDLAGAVMRQSIFTFKMYQLDWLHSPSSRETMARLITKYQRFVAIMAAHPTKTCVPTLDVDLAWHTHQLSPSAYYAYTTAHTTKFTDHDDKIEEDKLAEAFEWTMKTYQDKYAETYSECTCWYCETIRSAHTGTVSRLLGVSNQDKAAESFIASGRAKLCPPDKSAHISAHNAVRLPDSATSARSTVDAYRAQRQQAQLERAYVKACKRAEKKGRSLPPRDGYYDHWGYQYYMYSPFMYPLYWTPGLYYGADPGYMMGGGGVGWAACAAGSCGGGVAAGGCGGAGGCGASGAGGACAGGGGGCAGGGGGGCGGGGGGGCGGGGG